MEENPVIPAGSLPPEPPEPKANDNPDKETEPKQGPDYEKSFNELHKKFGQQSNEVGQLRKQNEELLNRLNSIEEQSKQRESMARNQEPPTDYEQELRNLSDQYDAGEISVHELMLKSNALTRKQTMAEADSKYGNVLEQASEQFRQTLSERDTQAAVDQFHKANPEFNEWMASGEIDAAIQQNPLLDPMSAFYALKAEKQFEAGKAEAARLQSGSEPASKVLTKPGNSIQQNNKSKQPLTGRALKESMMNSALAVE